MRRPILLVLALILSRPALAGKTLEGPLADPAHWERSEAPALIVEVAKAMEALDPKDSRTLARTGELLLHAGRTAEAQELFDRALKSDPKDDEACVIIAVAYRDMKAWDKADEWFRKATTLDPKDMDHVVEWGASYWLRGDKSKAAELFTRALAADPGAERLYHKIGLGIGQ
jgi:Flp pilus assembly protein TadD